MHASPDYISFLVRLWREEAAPQPRLPDDKPATPAGEPPATDPTWLVQIEIIPAGEKHYFISLEALFAFIRAFASGQEGKSASEQISR